MPERLHDAHITGLHISGCGSFLCGLDKMFQESLSLPLRHIDQELLVASRLLGQPLSLDSQSAEGKTIQLAYNPAMTRNDLSAPVMKTFSPGSAMVSIDGDGKNVVRTLRINNDTRDLWMGRVKEGGGFAEKSSIHVYQSGSDTVRTQYKQL